MENCKQLNELIYLKIINTMNFKSIFILATIFCLLFVMESFSQERNLTVNVNKPIAPIQPTMWGIFFEDINMAADGGIYAELVKNRSFEFFKPLMGWEILKPDTTTGVLILNRSETNPANPRYARISIGEGDDSFGLSNEGFRGMGIKKGMTYHFSVSARQAEGSTLEMRIEIVDTCLLYTSDAADEEDSVDLGGRRIIKK